MAKRMSVYLEVGAKKTYASALEWPGWSRGGRDEDGALEALLAYGPRYAEVVSRAQHTRLSLEPPRDASAFEIVQRIKGGASTDFGVPSLPASADHGPVDENELARQSALLRASWAAFDRAASAAVGVELRKGPRGGGRDLEKIIEHAEGAEESYLAQLGARYRREPGTDAATAWPSLREAILEALAARVRGRELASPTKVKRRWSPRYFVRRAAWHVLDHAWEIEDRARP